MIKQMNTKGREKSLNQTLLAYIDLCVNLIIILHIYLLLLFFLVLYYLTSQYLQIIID